MDQENLVSAHALTKGSTTQAGTVLAIASKTQKDLAAHLLQVLWAMNSGNTS
jgi:hypothetical protein